MQVERVYEGYLSQHNKEKKPADVNAGHMLRQRGTESENAPMPSFADIGPVIDYAAISYQTSLTSTTTLTTARYSTQRACVDLRRYHYDRCRNDDPSRKRQS